VVKRVGEVAYEMDLSLESQIHNVFHVSCLKKVLGQQVVAATELPLLDNEGHLILTKKLILETRGWKKRNRVLRELLVKWKDLLK